MYPMPQPQPQPMGQSPGAGPAPAPAAGAPQDGLHPEIAKNLLPNDPVQAALLNRIDELSDQDVQALRQGLTPPMTAVLAKIMPEVGFVLHKLTQGGGAPGGPP